MNGPRGYWLSKINPTQRQIPYDFTYMWNLKNTTNEQTKQNRNRLIDTVVVGGGGDGR